MLATLHQVHRCVACLCPVWYLCKVSVNLDALTSTVVNQDQVAQCNVDVRNDQDLLRAGQWSSGICGSEEARLSHQTHPVKKKHTRSHNSMKDHRYIFRFSLFNRHDHSCSYSNTFCFFYHQITRINLNYVWIIGINTWIDLNYCINIQSQQQLNLF